MPMKPRILMAGFILLLIMAAVPVQGDDPVSPTLLERTKAEEFFTRQQYVTSAGITYPAADSVKFEPLLGVGHEVRHLDFSVYNGGASHSITAQAGGKVRVLEGFYLSAAVKYPLYSFQRSGMPVPEQITASSGRGNIDIINPSAGNLTWTGEVGTAVGKYFRSLLYYDKITTPLMGTPAGKSEDRLGVKFQFSFK